MTQPIDLLTLQRIAGALRREFSEQELDTLNDPICELSARDLEYIMYLTNELDRSHGKPLPLSTLKKIRETLP